MANTLNSHQEEYNQAIRKIVQNFQSSYANMLKHSSAQRKLYEYIMLQTQAFPDLSLAARIFYVLTGQIEYVKCKVCGGDIPHKRKCNALSGYESLCCSRSCAQLDPDHKARQRALSMERYGVPHPNQSEYVRRRLSDKWHSKTDEQKEAIQKKHDRTCLDRYGVTHPMFRDNIRQKCADAWRNMTDEELEQRNQKTQATNLRLHGDENWRNTELAMETRRRHASEDPEFEKKINEKREQTCLEKYGVRNVFQCEDFNGSIELKKHVTAFHKYYENNPVAEPLFTADEYAADPHCELLWKCRTCGDVFRQKAYASCKTLVRCYKCQPLLHNISGAEKQILDFIRGVYDGKIIENSRKVIPPRELDIYLPELNLAVEYDGLYWHSTNMGTPSEYHLEKTIACSAAGIRLIHVLEPNWLADRDGIEDVLLRAMEMSPHTFDAMSPDIDVFELTLEQASMFFAQCGLILDSRSNFSIGIGFAGETMACASFGQTSDGMWHVQWREARGVNVKNALSRLMIEFDQKFGMQTRVTARLDRANEDIGVYEAAGFHTQEELPPVPWYWDYGHCILKLLSQEEIMRPEFLTGLNKFDPNKTEYKNLEDNKIFQVYDCGKIVMIR